MKPVYRCEYCDHMGTEDEVRTHEEKCIWNYDRRSCWTCKHRSGATKITCTLGTEIADGCLIEFCSKYENDGRSKMHTASDIFGKFFGGF